MKREQKLQIKVFRRLFPINISFYQKGENDESFWGCSYIKTLMAHRDLHSFPSESAPMGVMRYYSFSEVCALGACWQVASKNVIYGWRGKGRVVLDGG